MADNHSMNYNHRDINSIRRKWQKRHQMKIPNDDPEIPDEVRVAKRIHYTIGSKADLGTEKDTFVLATGQLTDPSAPPDETETTNESNSISSVSTSTTHSLETNRRRDARKTHEPGVGIISLTLEKMMY